MSKTFELNGVQLTLEQVKELAVQAELIKPEKVDKPFGELYKNFGGTLCHFVDGKSGFGFNNDGNWFGLTDSVADLSYSVWQPATESDRKRWEELLLEKARKDYPEGTVINNSNIYNFVSESSRRIVLGNYELSESVVQVGVESDWSESETLLDLETGEWAQIIIPELTHAQIEEKIGKFKYIG